jgi:hypothetical protein
VGPQVLLPPGAGLVLEQVQLCGEIVHLVVRSEASGACWAADPAVGSVLAR